MKKLFKNIRNTHIFHEYYSNLKNIALSVFEWENLPDTCNARFLEKVLFENGRAIFVKDDKMSFLNLRCNPVDVYNVYEQPTGYTAYSLNYDKNYSADECVFIRNNYLEKSTDFTIMMYAERLANIQLTIDVNINAQKTPILIRCDKQAKLSLDTIYNQYEDNKPKIFIDKSLHEKPLEILKTDAPYLADKLREEKRAVWNECLEFLGLNTNPSDKKKERLIISEVNANDEQIQIQAETMLLCRKQACEEINEKYGLNVSVKKRVESEVEEEWLNTQSNSEQLSKAE